MKYLYSFFYLIAYRNFYNVRCHCKHWWVIVCQLNNAI